VSLKQDRLRVAMPQAGQGVTMLELFSVAMRRRRPVPTTVGSTA